MTAAPTIPRKLATPSKRTRSAPSRKPPAATFQEPIPAVEPNKTLETQAAERQAQIDVITNRVNKELVKDDEKTAVDSNPDSETAAEDEITEDVLPEDNSTGRPTAYMGFKVVKEVPVPSPLPKAGPFRISKLHLEDQSIAYACRDCLFTNRSRGKVMQHRNENHGAQFGRKRSVAIPALRGTPDPVLPPRADGTPAPSDPRHWTIAELIALVPDLAALGDLIDRLETERDELLKELNERTRHSREDQHKIDVYETLQDEVVTLRLILNKQPDYEKVRAERDKLRAWKKNIIKKFTTAGFIFEEED